VLGIEKVDVKGCLICFAIAYRLRWNLQLVCHMKNFWEPSIKVVLLDSIKQSLNSLHRPSSHLVWMVHIRIYWNCL